ncbi:hypothetical protein PAHAL_7G013700 [Panicum hallii]|uniref:Uncharacterized protein n=1 Tax=Panicum hallii TaxID=206008 RepID=A0A2T8IAL5_9POAL|nr:hypothetical protein PAHAL_7G013700 [Panicum hallii]
MWCSNAIGVCQALPDGQQRIEDGLDGGARRRGVGGQHCSLLLPMGARGSPRRSHGPAGDDSEQGPTARQSEWLAPPRPPAGHRQNRRQLATLLRTAVQQPQRNRSDPIQRCGRPPVPRRSCAVGCSQRSV